MTFTGVVIALVGFFRAWDRGQQNRDLEMAERQHLAEQKDMLAPFLSNPAADARAAVHREFERDEQAIQEGPVFDVGMGKPPVGSPSLIEAALLWALDADTRIATSMILARLASHQQSGLTHSMTERNPEYDTDNPSGETDAVLRFESRELSETLRSALERATD